MDISIVAKFVDNASKGLNKLLKGQEKFEKSAKAASKFQNDKSINKLEQAQRGLARATQTTARALGDEARGLGKVAQAAGQAQTRLARLQKAQQHLKKGFGKMRGGLQTGAALGASYFGGAALLAGKFVGTASEFEKYQTILETTEGSQEKARAAMGWVSDFAAKTPYDLAQVTEAFVQLRAYGLDPTSGLLQTLGDTSAAMGKDVLQAVEAIADAVTGENERLKTFGITAAKNKGLISYTYTDSKGLQKVARAHANNRAEIEATLTKIMNEKYGGSMDRLSKTWDNMLSNLGDHWTRFQNMVMGAGLFDWMKEKLAGVLSTLDKWAADGTLQAKAEALGKKIQSALEAMWAFGEGLVKVFGGIADGLSVVARYVGGWENLALAMAALPLASTLISFASGLFMVGRGLALITMALAANPVTLIIAGIVVGIAALVYAGWWLYENWDKVIQWVGDAWNWLGETCAQVWQGITDTAQWAWDGITDMVGAGVDWLRGKVAGLWDGVAELWGAAKASLLDVWEGLKTSIGDIWEGIKAFFDWVPEINLPDLSGWWEGNEKSAKALEAHQKALEGFSGSTKEAVENIAKLGDVDRNDKWLKATEGLAGAQAEKAKVFNQLDNFAERGWGSDFKMGQGLNAQLQSGALDLAAYQAQLKQYIVSGGEYAKTAQEMLGESFKIADLDADMQRFEQTLKNIEAAASIDLTQQGANISQSLANGILSNAGAVTGAINSVTQDVRDHLPSSPAKTGPLSDLHRLKFSETIARSIQPGPMVEAMRRVAALTAGAAALSAPAFAAPVPSLVGPPAHLAASIAGGSGLATDGGGVRVHFAPQITIGAGASVDEAALKRLLAEQADELVRLIEERQHERGRLDF